MIQDKLLVKEDIIEATALYIIGNMWIDKAMTDQTTYLRSNNIIIHNKLFKKLRN